MIQAGSPLAHTRPGKPTPAAKVTRRLTASNSGHSAEGACQAWEQRRTLSRRSTVHSPAYSQDSPWPMAASIRGAASLRSRDSESIRLTSSSMARRRCWRSCRWCSARSYSASPVPWPSTLSDIANRGWRTHYRASAPGLPLLCLPIPLQAHLRLIQRCSSLRGQSVVGTVDTMVCSAQCCSAASPERQKATRRAMRVSMPSAPHPHRIHTHTGAVHVGDHSLPQPRDRRSLLGCSLQSPF